MFVQEDGSKMRLALPALMAGAEKLSCGIGICWLDETHGKYCGCWYHGLLEVVILRLSAAGT
jgi:hypothetical protein